MSVKNLLKIVCEYENEPKSVTILETKGFKTVKIIHYLKAL